MSSFSLRRNDGNESAENTTAPAAAAPPCESILSAATAAAVAVLCCSDGGRAAVKLEILPAHGQGTVGKGRTEEGRRESIYGVTVTGSICQDAT